MVVICQVSGIGQVEAVAKILDKEEAKRIMSILFPIYIPLLPRSILGPATRESSTYENFVSAFLLLGNTRGTSNRIILGGVTNLSDCFPESLHKKVPFFLQGLLGHAESIC